MDMLFFHYMTYVPHLQQNEMLMNRRNVEERIRRWMHREHIVDRASTHVAQNIIYDEVIVNDYMVYVRDTIRMHNYHPDYIINMDETNVYFDQKSKRTYTFEGERTVNIVTTASSGNYSQFPHFRSVFSAVCFVG